jgi:dTDP-4-amino-4,6-dideoxygalactose transaminase
MNVPMLDLRREYAAVEPRLAAFWSEALSRMQLLKGAHLVEFEQEIAEYTGVAGAVGVASGTDAITLALVAAGIGPGDEVLLQANGFIADVEAIRIAGATPVLVDVAESGYGPEPEALAAAVTRRTRAVLVVHLYGEPVEMRPIQEVCAAHSLQLVEDCSHAHGARLEGRHVGTFGVAGAFSAGPIKNLGAYGDAGFLITDDPEIERTVRLLQAHGQAKKNQHVRYGFNSRLDELQAAVLRAKLPLLEERNARRREFAHYYSSELREFCLAVPEQVARKTHAFHQYVVQVEDPSSLQAALKERGIETGVHYPVPLHRQQAWVSAYGERGSLPKTEALSERILSLPIIPDLTWEEVRYVAAVVQKALARVPVGTPDR